MPNGGTGSPRHLERIISSGSGENVCACCGQVVGIRQADARDGVPFSDNERTAPVYGAHTLGHTSPAHEKRHHMTPTRRETGAQHLHLSTDMLRDICERSGYGAPILAEATRIMRQQAAVLIKGRSREAMSLACIYIAHHAQKVPIPLRAFLMRHTGAVAGSGHSGGKMPDKTRKVLISIRLIKTRQTETGGFGAMRGVSMADIAAKILWDLDGRYDGRTIRSAIRSLGRTGAVLAGHIPEALAAATLYMHLRDGRLASGMDMRRVDSAAHQQAVASACGTTDITLRKMVGKLRDAGFRPDMGETA